MLNKRIAILFLGMGVFTQLSASALTMEQALNEANENSPELKADIADAEVATYGKTEAMAAFFPKLEMQADHYFDQKFQVLNVNFGGQTAAFPLITPTTVYALNLSWSVFNGLQDTNRLEAAKLQSKASDEDLSYARFTLNEEVKMAFTKVIASRELESVYDENIRNLQVHDDQVNARLRAGTALQVDVLRVEVQLNNARAQKISAHDDLIISEQKLAQLLGKASDSRKVEGELPNPDEDTAKRIETTSLGERADLRAIGLRSEASEKTLAADKNYWVPSLSVVGNYSFYNNETYAWVSSSDFRSAYQIGLELKWNIFDGLLSYARAKEAAARSVASIKREQVSKLQAVTDYETSKSEYRYQLTQFIAQTENLTRSKRSVDLALAGQRAGTQRNVDVLDAELDLFNARAGVIQAQLGAFNAKANFEKSVGRDI